MLVFPQGQPLPSAVEGLCHFPAKALFKVHFPLRVIRVGCPFDLAMPLNRHITCT